MAADGIDAELLANVKKARKAAAAKPHFFALIVKGAAAGKLLVSRKKIPEKQLAAAKKEVGANTVVRGLCFGEDGGLVLETVKAGPATMAALVRRLVKEGAGLTVAVDCRVGRDDEAVAESADDDSPEPEAGTAPAPAPPPADPVVARFAALGPRLKDVLTGGSAGAARVKTLAAAAASEIKAGNFAAATAAVDALTPLLAPRPPAAAPAPAFPAGEWKAKLEAWQPAIKAAIAAKGANATAVVKLFTDAAGLAKTDPAAAVAKLQECHTLATAPAAPATPAVVPDAAAGAATVARFNALGPALKAALAAKGPNLADVQKLAAAAAAGLKAKDFAAADTAIAALGKALAAPPPDEPEASETEEPEAEDDLATPTPNPTPDEDAAAAAEGLKLRLDEVRAEDAEIRDKLAELDKIPAADRTDKHARKREKLLARMANLYRGLMAERADYAAFVNR